MGMMTKIGFIIVAVITFDYILLMNKLNYVVNKLDILEDKLNILRGEQTDGNVD